MAAANEKATASITKKISLGGGTYLYIGTLAFGSEYATGGNELVTAANERYSLPERIDYFDVQNASGYALDYITGIPGKIMAWWTGTALKGVLEQVAAKTDLSALKTVPFICIGT
jgi:hypothetical protein